MKLMAISSRGRRGQWGRSSLEVLGLFNDAAARKMGLEDAK